jgi:hypothetical protein
LPSSVSPSPGQSSPGFSAWRMIRMVSVLMDDLRVQSLKKTARR